MKENIFNIYSDKKELFIFQTQKGKALFTLLSMDEYRLVERLAREIPSMIPQIEEDVWNKCVLEHSFPSDYRDLYAGIVSTVFRIILKKSCPRKVERIVDEINESRDNLKDIRDQIVALICQAFPSYKPEEVEAMTWQTQKKRLVQAEKILNTTFEITSGEDKKKESLSNKNVMMKTGEDGNQYIDFAAENREIFKGG